MMLRSEKGLIVDVPRPVSMMATPRDGFSECPRFCENYLGLICS